MHIYLTEDGLQYKIPDAELSGEGLESLSALIITPFLGASGGSQQFYDPETDMYGDPIEKPMIPGYVMIPDGPGALIRFRDNIVTFNRYIGTVYGINLADTLKTTSEELEIIPAKDPLAPVYGIAHGDRQAAFVFWADAGAEYLELLVSPEEQNTEYTYAYPRFVFNRAVEQVYSREGPGYQRLYPERNHFDIDATYNFLAGDGSEDGLPADYTGMALKYRAHLLDKGIIAEKKAESEMPIHFDFIMNDVKKDIIGTKDVIVTNTGNVESILRDLTEAGIRNINAGMMGAQSGGVTAGKPWRLKFDRSIGSKGDFRDLIANMTELGIDLYFTQNYAAINDLQMTLSTNMAYHRTNWGVERWISFEKNSNMPISRISFARPQKSAEWLVSQTDVMKDVGATSVGIEGISSRLTSHYGSDEMGATEAISLLSGVVAGLDMTVNAYSPNMYLWNSTDRFINASLLPTQYIIETDTVPFMQILLHGTMEMYAPYANFSFYSRDDILRMIDYNVFPSFVLTEEPAYLLANTNSSGFYSTSYDLYRDIIIDVYTDMAEIYDSIAGLAWTGRDILQNGIVLNKYEGGTRVLINYTEEAVTFEGYTAEPLSAMVLGG